MDDHARSVRRFAEELAGDLTRRGLHADGLLRAREDQPAAQAQEPERHGRRQQHQKGDAVEPGRLAGLVAQIERIRRELYRNGQRLMIAHGGRGLRRHGIFLRADVEIVVHHVAVVAARPLRRVRDLCRKRHGQGIAVNGIVPARLGQAQAELLAVRGLGRTARQRIAAGELLLAAEAGRIAQLQAGHAILQDRFIAPPGQRDVTRVRPERDEQAVLRGGKIHLRRHRDLAHAVLPDVDRRLERRQRRVRRQRTQAQRQRAENGKKKSPQGNLPHSFFFSSA